MSTSIRHTPIQQPSASSDEPSDDLAEAAGVMFGLVAGGILWTLIGLITWALM